MKILRWTLRLLGAFVVLAVVAAGALLAALNSGPGQREIERLANRMTYGTVQLSAISGSFPSAPHIGRIALADQDGVWLVVDNLALDWSPWRLLGGTALIRDLSADRIVWQRMPAAGSSQSSGGSTSLPAAIQLDRLHVGRLELGPSVAGAAAILSMDGAASIRSKTDGRAELTLTRLDAAGGYRLTGRLRPDGLHATVSLREPSQGLLSGLAGLPDLGALDMEADVEGPWQAAASRIDISAGPLRATAHGTVDLLANAADLDIRATAPAMAPRSDLSWQHVALSAHLHGPFTAPQADAKLVLDNLSASGSGLRQLVATLHGDRGVAQLHATIDGLRVPGPRPDTFGASPITLDADAVLNDPARTVRFAVHHDLFDLAGTARTAGQRGGTAKLTLPNLAPLAAVGGVDLQGSSSLDISATAEGGTTRLMLDGPIGITGGMAPLAGLIGPNGKLGLTAAMTGDDVALSRFAVDGGTLHLDAAGGMKNGNVELGWTLKLSDLRVLAATLAGNLSAAGRLQGPMDNLTAHADVTGEIASPGVPREPLTAHLDATGLPNRPQGQIDAQGSLDGAPLDLVASVARDADGGFAARIVRGDWKSAHLEGAVALAPGAAIPVGHIVARMERLDELAPLTGLQLAGSLDAAADIGTQDGREVATARLRMAGVGLAGTATARRIDLDARIADPQSAPQIDAQLQLDGLAAQGVGGAIRLSAKGPQNALDLALNADLTGVGGEPLAVHGAARLDANRSAATLSSFAADYKGETVRLLGPARLDYANGIAVDRLRLGLRDAALSIAGRLSPALDLTARLDNVTADLARIIAPDLQAAGTLQAEARLTGTPDRPTGRLRIAASGMRMTTGTAAAFPPANLLATADLAGTSTRIDAKLSAGANSVALTGTAPLNAAGAMDLHATGALDLATLDRIVAAGGRHVRGKAALDVAIAGTPLAPRPTGSLRLTDGEVQDFNLGAHVAAIDGLIEADGDAIRIGRFAGRAGPGTISLDGQLSLAPPMPIDIGIKMAQARPLASDKLTADMDADLHLHGDLAGQLALDGAIRIDNAEIRVPDSVSSQVAVLDVRVRGAPPPPPPAPGPDIALALRLDAPGRIFVRGRGLDAELSGALRIGGNADRPQPVGKFEMRRGTFNLAGQTLTFTTGEVGFDGSGKIDPTLNFVATSSNSAVTANLTVTGYASSPKIVLSSTPELPQDEILAQLLFHTSSSNLTALQLAQIAAGLAQISGAGGGFDPLNSIRGALGLDTLQVGGGQNGAGPSVTAGRYVAPGVFVGAKQSASGTGSQATVQIDLLKGLKLETNVATSSASQANSTGAASSDNGANVGLTYQFEY
jgi:translocation and assembly module TamB